MKLKNLFYLILICTTVTQLIEHNASAMKRRMTPYRERSFVARKTGQTERQILSGEQRSAPKSAPKMKEQPKPIKKNKQANNLKKPTTLLKKPENNLEKPQIQNERLSTKESSFTSSENNGLSSSQSDSSASKNSRSSDRISNGRTPRFKETSPQTMSREELEKRGHTPGPGYSEYMQ